MLSSSLYFGATKYVVQFFITIIGEMNNLKQIFENHKLFRILK